jgi:hypothetical protein
MTTRRDGRGGVGVPGSGEADYSTPTPISSTGTSVQVKEICVFTGTFTGLRCTRTT